MLLTAVPFLLAAALAFPQRPAPGQEPGGGEDPLESVQVPEEAVQDEGDTILLNFGETETGGLTLRQFIKVCQEHTGLNFTLDTSNTAALQELDRTQVLLYGPKRIRREDFFSFFQTMMKIYKYVVVKQGEGELAVYVITKQNATTSGDIKANTLFVDMQDAELFASQPGVYITTVVKLKYADAQNLGTSLRTALAGGGAGAGQDSFMPLPSENALLVQGFGPFVAAAVRLIRLLDSKPEVPKPEFARIPLQEASAEETAQLLQDLLEEDTGRVGGAPARRGVRGDQNATVAVDERIETRIQANPRDNSLLVFASEQNLEQIKDLVAELDRPLDSIETNFRVYQLQNINAEELEQPLRDFLERTQQAEEAAARNAQGGGPLRQPDQRIVVVAQPETNSLLVTATRTKWQELKRLLETLDQRQPQVLIEIALIEVSEDFAREIGFEYANVSPPSGSASRGFGFTQVGLSDLVDNDGDGFADTRIPITSTTGFTGGILDGEDFGLPFLLKAAQNRNDSNILSIPSILVTNNRSARVESKDLIPTTTQTSTQGVGVTETFNDFQEAGITLNISPSISAAKYLRMDIELTVSTFKGDPASTTVPPPKAERTLVTSVYLPDGATMWVGGIIKDDRFRTKTGIPFLSDIPILGDLFGARSDSTSKTTLYFFCTPRILDDFDELADLSERSKARAADVIGLDRVRQVDPAFRPDTPLDVILDEDLDGDGQVETGILDLSSFAAPVFVRAPAGELPPEDWSRVGADPRGLDHGLPLGAPGEPAAAPARPDGPGRSPVLDPSQLLGNPPPAGGGGR